MLILTPANDLNCFVLGILSCGHLRFPCLGHSGTCEYLRLHRLRHSGLFGLLYFGLLGAPSGSSPPIGETGPGLLGVSVISHRCAVYLDVA